jgi:colicin import membrane protein
MSAAKAAKKYFAGSAEFVQPDFEILEKFFDIEDECDAKLNTLYEAKRLAKKQKEADKVKALVSEIKDVEEQRKEARKNSKAEMDKHAFFNRAAKPFLDADKLLKQKENYKHLDDISSHYEEAKARYEKELAEKAAEAARKAAEEKAYDEKIKAEKAAKKAAKKK